MLDGTRAGDRIPTPASESERMAVARVAERTLDRRPRNLLRPMTRRTVAWLVAGGCALFLIGLIAYARGPEHHEGDSVGSHGTRILLIRNVGSTTTTTEQTATPSGPA
jgi:hypothetical protein